MSTETEIDRMKRIPIEEFLARLGHSPVQRRTNALWYKAPYREERTASFKVNMERNLWYDYGLGKGGNIFALAGEFIHCDDFLSQVRYVAEVAGMPLPEKKVYHPCEVRRPVEPSFEDVELMRKHCPPRMQVKAAGGISTLADAERFLELGASRLGTSRIVKSAQEAT